MQAARVDDIDAVLAQTVTSVGETADHVEVAETAAAVVAAVMAMAVAMVAVAPG